MAANPSPNPKSNMWNFIAWYLRIWRIAHGMTGEDLGRIMKASKATVSRVENGHERLSGTQAMMIDKAANTGGLFTLLVWYASIGHDPEWFAQYVELEQQSSIVRFYGALVVNGLLQTEDYARALAKAGLDADPEKMVLDRMQRQAILLREPAPHMTAILSQNALEWPVGGPHVLRAQLAHLLEMAKLPHVVIRVVPREVGAFPGLTGSFQLISGSGFGEVAYTESPGAGRLVSSPEDVMSYVVRYELISAVALSESASLELIRRILEAIRD
ncbi:helix-turn-helix domain-containing protein [Actinomadura harenae]|uniref:XRE family transcriptional regulator n=1 Tax=Actinomadura harenae TaxID=2483351 RepID=A0A3M2LT57_9ACTN|nr:helix-turn-helix transcriptional regulator [Actinomadura harenae]RMI40597.1 XRE family transcriptional regulator [Actinomadura harenae]